MIDSGMQQPDAAETWSPGQEFDRRARGQDHRLDPAFLRVVADTMSDEMLMSLLGEFSDLCLDDDRAAAERYAGHLLALAELLDDQVHRTVRAAIDVETAGLFVRTGDLAEAQLRADRCAADLEELLPGRLGDRERALAVLAEADGRGSDARDHTCRARDLFAECKRWGEAALAAEVAARMHPTMNPEALDEWRMAAELYVAADALAEARGCVEQACALVLQLLAGGGDHRMMSTMCETARTLALNNELPEPAARLGLALAMFAGDTDMSWPDVLHRHEASRRELSALNLDAAELHGVLGQVDLSLGRAALARGRIDDARHHLSAALPELRAAELDDGVQMCEAMLHTLDVASAGGPVRAAQADRFTDPDVRAGVLLTDAVQLAIQGRHDEALAQLKESTALVTVGTPERKLMVDAVTAAVHHIAGDQSRTPTMLTRIDSFLATAEDRLTHSARNLLIQVTKLLAADSHRPADGNVVGVADFDAALTELRRLPADLPSTGQRAAALVEGFVASEPLDHLTRWRELDELLGIADAAMPSTPGWIRVRTIARVSILLGAVAERELTDLEAATARLTALEEESADPTLAPIFEGARMVVRMGRMIHQGDDVGLIRFAEHVNRYLDGFPADHPQLQPAREMLTAAVNVMATNAGRGDVGASIREMLRTLDQLPDTGSDSEITEELMVAALLTGSADGGEERRLTDEQLADLEKRADQPGLGDIERALRQSAVAMAALQGGQETNLDRVELAIAHLRGAVELTQPRHPQRTFHMGLLGSGLYRRHELTNSMDDLREARTFVAEARNLAGGPAHPMWPMLNQVWADIAQVLGDDPDFLKAILDGLRTHVWQVLVQPDLVGATMAARDAASDAVDAARTCLIAHDPAAAIAALDTGRGLALYAATEIHTVADRLDAAGLDELAERWRAAAAERDAAASSELQREVLTALTEHDAGADLLSPPDFGTIQWALTEIDADALIYLVPGAGPITGYAVVAPAVGRPSFLALPNLALENQPDIGQYLDALAGRDLAPVNPAIGCDADDAALAAALERLCHWAWGAAMGPIIESWLPDLPTSASGRVPRIVLVPMGDLARIPWQAARRRRDGVAAIELLAVSQAASARMLCRSATLSPVPPGSTGLLVGDPDARGRAPDLDAARLEALAIRQTFYRGARYVGRRPDGSTSPSGAGTSVEIRRWLAATDLAAGGMLHLACHGVVDTGTEAPRAYLVLAGEDELSAQELIAEMAREPQREVSLVVLAACRTGRSMNGYDEAYSLGTAFLAGGARSVLSTQWSIPDAATSVLMFMFHHFLRSTGLPIWAALREAQLWMLNPAHVIPEEMPPVLRRQLNTGALQDVVSWAGFVHWGQ